VRVVHQQRIEIRHCSPDGGHIARTIMNVIASRCKYYINDYLQIFCDVAHLERIINEYKFDNRTIHWGINGFSGLTFTEMREAEEYPWEYFISEYAFGCKYFDVAAIITFYRHSHVNIEFYEAQAAPSPNDPG
jgi:hypothetical protein